MVEAIATATEMKNQFGKYLQMVINGNEVIVTKNGQEVGRFIPKAKTVSYLTDSLTGLLKGNYDYEDASPVGRISLLSKEEKTKNAIAFLERIKRNNYPHMLYTNLYWTEHCYELEKLMNYDIWFAQYYKYPQYPHNFLIWQYSEDGIVDGIEEKVDLNIMFIKK